jgi:hypothetical protein
MSGFIEMSAVFSPPARRVLFLLSLGAFIPIFATLGQISFALQNPTAPQGVMSFELAGTLARQNEMLASWTPLQILRLAFDLGLGFACLAAMLAVLGLACLWLSGRILAYGLLAVAPLWAVENILMAQALFGHGTNLMAQVVYWCALVKFTVTGVSLAYIVLRGGAMAAMGIFRRGV